VRVSVVIPVKDGAASLPPLLAGLAALALLAVVGFVLLSGGDNGRSDGDKQQAAQTQRHKAKRTPTPTPSAESTPKPTATATATPTATPTATTAPTSGPDLARARSLQVQGYNARRAGQYEAGLTASTAALRACGTTHALDPCGYALYEIGADLVALGRNSEAIPFLERRLSEYGDNNAGDVQQALDQARGEKPNKKGKGPKGPKGEGDD
jgi:hypothetical protein